jgi:glutamyl-tRNA reductase
MDLLVVGLNHRTAPVSLRERVAFSVDQLAVALPALKKAGAFRELAILSTCNRTEAIVVAENADPSSIVSWFAEYHSIPTSELADSIYTHQGTQAVQHAMRVACGLDSMVIGEPQIFGQFKECFSIAQIHNTLGPDLNNLAQTTNRIAKQVRTETGIGENPVSVASTSVTLAKQLFTEVASCNALLIGAGETIELVARHLKDTGVSNLVIANRTLAHAETLAQEFDAQAVDLSAVPLILEDTDIVITSTGSELPILGKGTVERVLKSRRHKPIFMVDLAVPRDIEPEVADLNDVYLYSIDDLQEIIVENLGLRQSAADDALRIIDQAVHQYTENYNSQDAVDTLRRFRAHHETLKQAELAKARARLANGDDPETVITALANQLTNKIIHVPSIEIKKAGSQKETLLTIERLFQLDDDA